jgi:multiple sugar transport system substrate-binding protein
VVKGTSLGVPWFVDTRVIYYRTDLAKKAGYTTAPKTFAEFKAMTKAMQTKAGAKWGVNLPPSGTDSFQSALPFFWSAGASLMNADDTKWTFDTAQMTAGLKYYQSFFTDGIADPNVSPLGGSKEAAFVNGTTPVFLDSPALISLVNAAGGTGFDKKYSVMTIPKDKSSTSFVGGGNLVVFKKSANSGAAWKLVQYLSKPSVQADWYKATGDLPSVQSAWDDPSLTADPKLAVFKEQLSDAKAPPANTAWTQVGAAADAQLEKVVRGADAASAVKTLQSEADSIGTGD